MRTVPYVAGLAFLSALALAACSSSGGGTGAGGSGGASAGSGGNVAAYRRYTERRRGPRWARRRAARPAPTAAARPAAAGAFGISGPTRCDTTLPLCESFESGLDANLWKTTKAGDATIAVDEVHAARGSKALHVKTAAGGGSNFAYIKETKTFPATNNVLYGRMFVWFEDALTTDGHYTLAEGAGSGTPR